MKKPLFFFLFLLVAFSANSQMDILSARTRAALVKNIDSAMRTVYFITTADAEKILGKKVFLKDSAYKFSGNVLRYNLDYIAVFIDSTSKGRLMFNFEQYKDT